MTDDPLKEDPRTKGAPVEECRAWVAEHGDAYRAEMTRELTEGDAAVIWPSRALASLDYIEALLAEIDRRTTDQRIAMTALINACHDGWADGTGALGGYLRDAREADERAQSAERTTSILPGESDG